MLANRLPDFLAAFLAWADRVFAFLRFAMPLMVASLAAKVK
jgi:hypothetical protein